MTTRTDNFNRADSSSSIQSPSDGGANYGVNGTWGITSNKGYKVATDATYEIIALDSGSSNVDIQVTIVTQNSFLGGLVGRAASNNDFIMGYCESSTILRLYKRVAGTFTALGTLFTGTNADGDVLKLEIDSSNNITLFQNGVSRTTANDSAGATNTAHGPVSYHGGLGVSAYFDDLSITAISAAASPFQQTEWPLPRGTTPGVVLRTWTDPLKLNLLGQDRFFGGAGQPPANLNWPVPAGRPTPLDARTWFQNLLQTTLVPVNPGTPFYQTEWPLPRGATPGIVLRSWTDPLKLNLLGQDKFFGPAGMPPTYDWQNPRGATPGIILRTWTDPLKLNLYGKDKFFGVAGQPPTNYDWPVPKGKRAVYELRTLLLNLMQGTLGPIVIVPPAPVYLQPASGARSLKPSIPSIPSNTPAGVKPILEALKENVELMTGRRQKQNLLSTLDSAASVDDIVAKINEILSRLQ